MSKRNNDLRAYLRQRLEENLPRYNMTELAELMNVSPWTVRRWAKALGHKPGRGGCRRRQAKPAEPTVAFPPKKGIASEQAQTRVERMMELSRIMGAA